MNKQPRNVKAAIKKYGIEKCKQAYEAHSRWGEGASSVALLYVGGTTRQADAMINAGLWLADPKQYEYLYAPETDNDESSKFNGTEQRFYGDNEVNNSRAASAFDMFRNAGGFDN